MRPRGYIAGIDIGSRTLLLECATWQLFWVSGIWHYFSEKGTRKEFFGMYGTYTLSGLEANGTCTKMHHGSYIRLLNLQHILMINCHLKISGSTWISSAMPLKHSPMLENAKRNVLDKWYCLVEIQHEGLPCNMAIYGKLILIELYHHVEASRFSSGLSFQKEYWVSQKANPVCKWV